MTFGDSTQVNPQCFDAQCYQLLFRYQVTKGPLSGILSHQKLRFDFLHIQQILLPSPRLPAPPPSTTFFGSGNFPHLPLAQAYMRQPSTGLIAVTKDNFYTGHDITNPINVSLLWGKSLKNYHYICIYCLISLYMGTIILWLWPLFSPFRRKPDCKKISFNAGHSIPRLVLHQPLGLDFDLRKM